LDGFTVFCLKRPVVSARPARQYFAAGVLRLKLLYKSFVTNFRNYAANPHRTRGCNPLFWDMGSYLCKEISDAQHELEAGQ
jgi:hypothetical protein